MLPVRMNICEAHGSIEAFTLRCFWSQSDPLDLAECRLVPWAPLSLLCLEEAPRRRHALKR